MGDKQKHLIKPDTPRTQDRNDVLFINPVLEACENENYDAVRNSKDFTDRERLLKLVKKEATKRAENNGKQFDPAELGTLTPEKFCDYNIDTYNKRVKGAKSRGELPN